MKKKFIFCILLIFCLWPCLCFAEDLIKIHFIDAGEGDAILIQTPQDENILIDAGNVISGFRVEDYLRKNNVSTLDWLIFTHSGLDHIGGAFFILPMFAVNKICDNGQDISGLSKSQDVYRWYEELVRKDRRYEKVDRGKKFIFKEISLEVLWPDKKPVFSDFNPNSLVLMLSSGKFRCLLTGDLTSAAEAELLKEKFDLSADVLKIGHHGADDSTSAEFLKAVSAKIGVISVNQDNISGYPHADTLRRLKQAGCRVYRTDEQGDIVISADKNGKVSLK